MTVPAWSVPAALGATALALAWWNLSLGSQLSRLPGASRAFRLLSGLGAFLLFPALAIGMFAPTALGARVFDTLAWLWPVVAACVASQALWVLFGRRAGVLVALPIALFDLLVAWIVVARWAEGTGAALPAWALAPGAAVSSLAAATLGEGAFLWGAAALVPVLAPAAPVRSRLRRVGRAIVASGSLAVTVLIATLVPDANAGIKAMQTLASDAIPERARGEFAVGLRLFGTLSAAPAAAAVRHDVALADSLGVTALHIELSPDAASTSVLDSVAHSIESRRDSVVLVVTLDLPTGGPAPHPDESWMRARLTLLERIVRRLRPDILAPAERVQSGPASPDNAWWQSYYQRAAIAARRIDRDVTIALATEAATAADSTLTDWVMQGSTPVDAVALSARGGYEDPARFESALAAVARWASLARVVPPVWIVGVPAAPAVTGEVAQQHLVRHALAWGAAHPWIRGVIAGDASDATTATGLRSASGRSRRAVSEVGATLRALRDLPPTLRAAGDSLTGDTVRSVPDTTPPPTP